MTDKELMKKFLLFVTDFLGLEQPCRVKLTRDREDITTSAYYNIEEYYACIYIQDRAIMDVMRSVAHELVHHHQNEKGEDRKSVV